MKMMRNVLVMAMMMLFAQLSLANMPAEKQQKMATKMHETEMAIGIKPEQKAAWDEYTKAVNHRANTMYDAKMKVKSDNVGAFKENKVYSNTAMERLNKKIAFEQTNLKSLEDMKPALEKLYASLTPEQKKIADQRLKIK